MNTRYYFLLLPLALASCDMMPSWLGGSDTPKKSTKLEGERLPVLQEATALAPDTALAAAPAGIPSAEENADWPQHSNTLANPALPAQLEHHDSATAGKGNSFDYKLVTAPVVGGSSVFAMDALGRISAHDAKKIRTRRWVSMGVASQDDEPVMGGGLAYDNGKLYAACGRGLVAAFDAATGKELWRQAIGTPVRSAPRVQGNHVYIVTDDSQFFALDSASGSILWSHRGVNEGTGFLVAATPAATDNLAFAPYATGEIYALHSESGEPAWNDALVSRQHTGGAAFFTALAADPVVAADTLYVAGSAKELAAFDVDTGRRLWEQPVSSVATPWVAGDVLYLLTSDDMVTAFERADGRVRWSHQLRIYKDQKDKKDRYSWNGPVLAGGRLLIVGAHGKMVELSPQDGSQLAETDIPEGIYTAPVVAGGMLYLVAADATLYALY